MAVSLTIEPRISGSVTKTPTLGSVITFQLPSGTKKIFTNGAGANQISAAYAETRILAGSASENLDLSGALTDPLWNAVVLTKLKFLYVENHADSSGNIIVGAGTAGIVGPFIAATNALTIAPGGNVEIANPSAGGYTVTATTADILKVENSGAGTSTYDIIIGGA